MCFVHYITPTGESALKRSDVTISTDLADLGDVSFDELRMRPDELEPFQEIVGAQVERPRVNLGGSGPPGRAD